MSVCIARLSVYHVFTAREGQNWSYRWLGAVKQVLCRGAAADHLSVPICVLTSYDLNTAPHELYNSQVQIHSAYSLHIPGKSPYACIILQSKKS